MKIRFYSLTLFSAALLFIGFSSIGESQGPPRSGDVVPNQFIVRLVDQVGDVEGTAGDIARRVGGTVTHTFSHAVKGFALTVPPGVGPEALRDFRVASVEPDRLVTLQDLPLTRQSAGGVKGPNQSSPPQPPQETPTGISRIEAHLNGKYTGDNTALHIAVIDTGIDLSHPDLNRKAGNNCTGRGSPNDGHGHGTHVAGTVAALNNSIGVVGVAPGATVWAVKVLSNSGSGFLSWVICGVDWVDAHSPAKNTSPSSTNPIIDVANMSLGMTGHSTALQAAVQTAVADGVTFAVAAGNSSTDASCCDPSSYPEVITVSAMADYDGQPGGALPALCSGSDFSPYGLDDSFATFSNYGASIDLAAPGVCITSTYKGGSYAIMSGTSMASPHVAGAAALYIASQRAAGVGRPSPVQVRDALIAAGWPQHMTNIDGNCSPNSSAFTGDPDHGHSSLTGCPTASGYDEPLVHASGL